MPFEAPVINPDDLDPVVTPTEQTATKKKKKGFNPNQLRKTIVTKIDKDGFHERTVYYGKDSAGSGDWSIAKITYHSTNGSFIVTEYVSVTDEGIKYFYDQNISVTPENDFVIYAPLYKGTGIMPEMSLSNGPEGYVDYDNTIFTGEIEVLDSGMRVIHGDCEITFNIVTSV